MAGKARVSVQASLVDGVLSAQWPDSIFSYQQSGNGSDNNFWNVATTITNFAPTNVPNPGYVFLKNLDSTNPVEIGYNDGGTLRGLCTLQPNGGIAVFDLKAGRTLAGIATGSTVKLQYFTMEK